jgi:hypothetical protein
LPPYGGPSNQELIDLLLSKVSSLQTIVEGKADIGKLRTYIQFSDEAIRIQAENIAMVGAVTFLDVWRDQTGQVVGGVHPSLTQIRGGVVKTGQIVSTNYASTTGSLFDLDNGTLRMGGSTASKFYFNSGTGDLEISGTLRADSVIAKDVQITGISGTPTLEDIYDLAVAGGITLVDVENLLAAGVDAILAGGTGDFLLDVDNTKLYARHKNAAPFTTIGGYAGMLRTALAVTSNGIAMGYHRTSDGVWINSVTIDGTTGQGTFIGAITATSGSFVGTVSAGSIITSSVTVSGVTLATISSNAADGKSIQTKLETASSLTLLGVINPTNSGAIKAGAITWDTSTGALVSGSGIAITEWGIIGATSGVAKFSLDTSGNAIFSGSLSAATGTFAGSLSAATGTFAGTISTTGTVSASGTSSNPTGIPASIIGVNTASGVAGGAFSATGSSSVGVIATGVAQGVWALSGSSGVALQATNLSGTALLIQGKMTKSNSSTDRIRVYDTSTNAFVQEYRYEFT